jgi:hypothetical protein
LGGGLGGEIGEADDDGRGEGITTEEVGEQWVTAIWFHGDSWVWVKNENTGSKKRRQWWD